MILKTDDNTIKVVRDFLGNYDIKDLKKDKPVTLVDCKKDADGRIMLRK